jgi:glycosyltransferase involved in cell wall biosynthesis
MRSRFGSEDLPTFTFVGRLTEEKGLDYLVDASAKSVVPHRVAIAGRGPLFDETQKLVKSRSIEDRFRFLGYVGQDELPALLNASDGLVLPSISTTRWKEPWGLVVNEAMNASLPVIATDAVGAAAGGLLVHDKTGLVVPQKDSDSLAAAIDALAADPEKRRRLGDAASARVLEWNHIAQADGFEQALAAARVRTRTTAGSAWPVNAEAAAGPGDTIG